ncbi:hypothetical protein SADUNF_Sadunf14G0085600 [Salix dunnii]|uniref:Uncharacterized protein n=1 Tax=Salix dunnii TaxID=1413687 RepID=A0A835JIX9_9ROSI|nr:hypothetical protein SADUNF_Sadunf14G0085600 [Salix dunnii]
MHDITSANEPSSRSSLAPCCCSDVPSTSAVPRDRIGREEKDRKRRRLYDDEQQSRSFEREYFTEDIHSRRLPLIFFVSRPCKKSQDKKHIEDMVLISDSLCNADQKIDFDWITHQIFLSNYPSLGLVAKRGR